MGEWRFTKITMQKDDTKDFLIMAISSSSLGFLSGFAIWLIAHI